MFLVPGQPLDGGGGGGLEMWFLDGTGKGDGNPQVLIGVGEKKRLSWSAGTRAIGRVCTMLKKCCGRPPVSGPNRGLLQTGKDSTGCVVP